MKIPTLTSGTSGERVRLHNQLHCWDELVGKIVGPAKQQTVQLFEQQQPCW